MVRSFPRKNRRRSIAALALSGLLLTAVAVPLAHAENLKSKKHKVEKTIKQTHDHLDESSKRLQAATAALLQSQRDLATARVYLAKTVAELTAARILDQQMQVKLDAAKARLGRARLALVQGREQAADQNLLLRRIVVSNYQQGNPSLMGLSSVLTSQDPAQLTGQMKAVETVMDKESVILDRLEATKVLLTVKQRDVNAAKIEVAAQRRAAAENLVRKQSLESQAQQAEAEVAEMVSLRAQARSAAMQAKRFDLKQLAKLQAERDRIERLIREQASHGSGYTGPVTGNGFLAWPAPGRVTSPYGWRTHPIYGYRSTARRHRHRGRLRRTAQGGPVRQGAVQVLPERLGKPADHRPRRQVRRRSRDDLQPHVRVRGLHWRPRQEGPDDRVRRQHGLVDRLSPALLGPGERPRRRPDEVAVAAHNPVAPA